MNFPSGPKKISRSEEENWCVNTTRVAHEEKLIFPC